MDSNSLFTENEMVVDEELGFPKAYAKLCQTRHDFYPYNQGPPSSFIPYKLHFDEALKARDMNHMFPTIASDKKPYPDTKNYTNLLWKQLNHIGNAGFDPAYFRIDTYGNVLYFYAQSGSPLAWNIDHWFPYSRGGKTVPSNLRILQSQVCKRKQNKLEFLVPWWDLQLGISVSQFLSIFASENSDFRKKAFSWLFSDAKNEDYDVMQMVESHVFPQNFTEKKHKVGLAPAAIVISCAELDASALKPVDLNKNTRPNSLATSAKKCSVRDDQAPCKTVGRLPSTMKENNNSLMACNKYGISAAPRDSLKHAEANKLAEMQDLEDELNQMKNKNESQRLVLQELESTLVKHRRRVEKCRRLAETQSSYRDLLEKRIRDAMHQTVVYKEQTRLNQAANTALMARLEAQRAICDSSETELHRRYKQRDELETQLRCYWEQARKRSRMDDTLTEERYSETSESKTPRGKELRLLLEEQKAFETGTSLAEKKQRERHLIIETKERELTDRFTVRTDDWRKTDGRKIRIVRQNPQKVDEDGRFKKVTEKKRANSVPRSPQSGGEEPGFMDRITKFSISTQDWRKTGGKKKIHSVPQSPQKENEDRQFEKFTKKNKVYSVPQSPQSEDEEYRKMVGKENLDKWLRMLYREEISLPGSPTHSKGPSTTETSENIKKWSTRKPQQESSDFQNGNQPNEKREKETEKKKCERSISNEIGSCKEKQIGNSKKFEAKEWERRLAPKTFRPIPPASFNNSGDEKPCKLQR